MDVVYKKATYFTGAILVICFLGFFPTYFGLFPSFSGTSLVVHFHVFTLIIWLALLLVQPILIRRGHLRLHRLIGKFSYGWVVLIILGFIMIIDEGQRKVKEPELIMATLFDAGQFIFFYIMGILTRKKTKYHARYMLLTILPFINPSIGRLISPMVSVPIELLILLTLIVVEYFNTKVYKPYVIGLVAYFVLFGIVIYFVTAQKELLEKIWMMIWG